jgi:hypothetical protein
LPRHRVQRAHELGEVALEDDHTGIAPHHQRLRGSIEDIPLKIY